LQLSHRQAFWLILILGLAVRLFFALYIPLHPADKPFPGYNDEPLHLFYVQHIASGNGWPIWEQPSDSLSYLTDSFVQPPLYYSLTTPLYNLGRLLGSKLLLTRLFSVLCGVLAALLVYRMALMWSDRESIAVSAFAAMMLAPNSIIFTSIVTNDALIILTSALFFYLLIQHNRESPTVLKMVTIGLSLSIAVWSKMSGLTLIPLIWFAVQGEYNKSRQWKNLVAILIVTLICIAPLLSWNLTHYGEPIPGQTQQLASEYWPQEALGVTGGGISHPVMAAHHWLRLSIIPFSDLWGGWEKWFSLLWAAIFTSIFLVGFYRIIKENSEGTLFIIGFLSVAVGFIWHNIHLFQVEFRLFAPAFPAIAVIMALGMRKLKVPIIGQILVWIAPIIVMMLLGIKQ